MHTSEWMCAFFMRGMLVRLSLEGGRESLEGKQKPIEDERNSPMDALIKRKLP
jgi:hypothetical protein